MHLWHSCKARMDDAGEWTTLVVWCRLVFAYFCIELQKGFLWEACKFVVAAKWRAYAVVIQAIRRKMDAARL